MSTASDRDPELNADAGHPQLIISYLRFVWPRFLRLPRASATAPGITLAVFFGILSISVTIGVAIFGTDSVEVVLAFVIGSVFLASIFAVVIAGSLAFVFLAPNKYAHVMLSGQGTEERFRTLAIHAHLECVRFLYGTKGDPWYRYLGSRFLVQGSSNRRDGFCTLERALGDIQLKCSGKTPADVRELVTDTREQIQGLWKAEEERVDEHIQRLKLLESRARKRLRRIQAMKEFTADESGFPVRRLCDHMLQYSPSIHRNRTWKYRRNWEEMSVAVKALKSPAEVNRFGGLAKQNTNIRENAAKRAELQDRLIRYYQLHPYLYELWSVHSTSGSLQTYAHLIAGIARDLETSLTSGDLRPESKEKWLNDALQRFRFVYRKQRAYPGFDLHAALMRLLEVLRERDPDCSRAVADIQRGFLKRVQDAEGLFPSEIDDLLSETDNQLTEIKDPYSRTCRRVEGVLRHLRKLPEDVTRSVASSRTKIVRQFSNLYNGFIGAGSTKSFVVTHGYSKTVREAITRFDPGEKSKTRSDPGTKSNPYLFLVVSDESDEFDTRLMELEINEIFRDETAPAPPNTHLASGEIGVLLRLLSPGDKVIVLLGAECFDTERRVVHPRGIVDDLGAFLSAAGSEEVGAEVVVTVLAEPYKNQKKLLTQTAFYDDHFDRVDLYRFEDIHIVLTGDECFCRKDWRDRVQGWISQTCSD